MKKRHTHTQMTQGKYEEEKSHHNRIEKNYDTNKTSQMGQTTRTKAKREAEGRAQPKQGNTRIKIDIINNIYYLFQANVLIYFGY